MELFNIAAILITLAALLSYINLRFIKLPNTIGLMLTSLILSLVLIFAGKMGWGIEEKAQLLLASIDFNKALLHCMLSFLLFAGAIHIDFNDLMEQKWIIGICSTIGVAVSMFITGGLVYYVFIALGMRIDFIYCLLFGALISPTDPIAVLGILSSAGAPKSMKTKITGESLFNDGVGVVVFVVILNIVTGTQPEIGNIAKLFLHEAVGGVAFGLIIGYAAYHLIKSIDNYQVEVLLTLALVMGGYALAFALHTSGPIAIVVAGLFIGNHGRRLGMSPKTTERLDDFWELLDEILNAVLFVLIGLEVLLLTFHSSYFIAAAVAIPCVLLGRFISVAIPISIMGKYQEFMPGTIKFMTWGGLRGGISIALALSIPAVNGAGASITSEREAILAITYIVVAFSILVQGTTVKRLINSIMSGQKA